MQLTELKISVIMSFTLFIIVSLWTSIFYHLYRFRERINGKRMCFFCKKNAYILREYDENIIRGKRIYILPHQKNSLKHFFRHIVYHFSS